MAGMVRSYVGGYFGLQFDGDPATGILKTCTPANYEGEKMEIPSSAEYLNRKALQNSKVGEFKCTFGMHAQTKPWYDWVNMTLESKHGYKNGALKIGDYNLDCKYEIQFRDALLTSFALPAMDAGAKETGVIECGFRPEWMEVKAGSGKLDRAAVNVAQKSFLPSNFKFTIDGLEDSCSKVSKVDALTIKQTVIDDPIGSARHAQIIGSKVEVPDVVWTTSEVVADQVLAWHKDFVIDGKCDDSMERNGELILLDPSTTKELLHVTFEHLGIMKLAPEKIDQKGAQARKVTITCYCEKITIKPPSA